MTCTYEELDGAYVLGALCPSERADFEHHLRTCDACRASVTALAVLPGLLGRLSTETADQLAPSPEAPVTAPTTLLPRLLTAATQRRKKDRRNRRVWFGAGALAVACLALVVGLGVHAIDMSRVTPRVEMSSMQPAEEHMPVTAEIGLSSTTGGTMVHMACRYEVDYQGSWTLWLVVYPIVGVPEQVGSWTAKTGDEIALTAVTHYPADQIGRIELRNAKEALMSWTPS
jgi:anti-sigma-K factor RskA